MTATTDRPSIKARALAAYERQREQQEQQRQREDAVKYERLCQALVEEMHRLGIDRRDYTIERAWATGLPYARLHEADICLAPTHNGFNVQIDEGVPRPTSVQNFWANLGAWLTED